MTLSVEASGLSKSFQDTRVLEGIDLRVEPGEVFAVLGPSGAGKTTLLRCLDFLLRPDDGAVRYGGRAPPADAASLLDLRRRIGVIDQNPLLFRGSVFYNVAYGLRVRGVEGPDLRVRVFRALEAVGLLAFVSARAADLSGGEAQRVAFARAIVSRPDVLLLDEYTANLDPANVNALEGAVREYNRSAGATVVLVTHNLFQAKRLARRVALLMDGRVVEVGPTEQVFDSPRDPRTRAFVRGEFAY